MSRRERISDFTRVNPRVADTRVTARHARDPEFKIAEQSNVATEETYTDIKRPGVKIKPAHPRQNKSNVLRRQGLKKLPPFVPKKVKTRLSLKLAIGIGVVVIFIAGLGSFAGITHQRSLKKEEAAAVQAAVDTKEQLSPDELLEKEVTQAEHNSHTVSKEAPRYLRSPKLQMDARVVALPVAQGKSLPDPANIFDVGWYEGSNLPNVPGAALMAGYVASTTKDGVFGRIGSLNKGDLLEIELGDGSRIKYRVVTTKTYNPEALDMNELLASVVPEKQGLNLVTVTKRFDVRTQKYENRFAVFAVRE